MWKTFWRKNLTILEIKQLKENFYVLTKKRMENSRILEWAFLENSRISNDELSLTSGVLMENTTIRFFYCDSFIDIVKCYETGRWTFLMHIYLLAQSSQTPNHIKSNYINKEIAVKKFRLLLALLRNFITFYKETSSSIET